MSAGVSVAAAGFFLLFTRPSARAAGDGPLSRAIRRRVHLALDHRDLGFFLRAGTLRAGAPAVALALDSFPPRGSLPVRIAAARRCRPVFGLALYGRLSLLFQCPYGMPAGATGTPAA